MNYAHDARFHQHYRKKEKDKIVFHTHFDFENWNVSKQLGIESSKKNNKNNKNRYK